VGEQLSIGVELVDGRENRVLWGESYHRPFSDVFEIQEKIVENVARGLRLRLTGEEEARLMRRPTDNSKAYEDYLKGNFFRDQMVGDLETASTLERKAIQCYRHAIEKDPNFALAYVGLSRAHKWLGLTTRSNQAFSESKNLAQIALDLDPDSTQAHLHMAHLLVDERDWKGAEAEYQVVRNLDPQAQVFSTYYFWLIWMGRLDEAVEAAERRERIADPLSDGQTQSLGYGYYWCREYGRALEKGLKIDDLWLQMLSHQAMGRHNEVFEMAMKDHLDKGRAPEDQLEYRETFKREGLEGFWRLWAEREVSILDQTPADKPIPVNLFYDIGAAYAFAGEKDRAFDWLSKACEFPNTMLFVTDARCDSLRDDPRYEQLLRKLNLPEEAIARHLKADYRDQGNWR
jgi:tetratricopeptide (TPR) repeat protein